VALEVGHVLQSKGWTINYHFCSDLVPSSEISTLIADLYQVPNSPAHLNNVRGNDTFPVKGSYPALLILDQAENLLEGDQSTLASKSLQSLVDALLELRSVRLLLVSRKQIRLTDGLAFYIKLEPLSDAAAIQLLQMVTRITSQRDLEVIAKGCGCNPLALMIVRSLIRKGVSEMDLISEMSSPEHFWKKLFYSGEKCHVIRGAESKRSQKDCLKLPFNSLLEMQNKVQMLLFLKSWVEETNCLDEKLALSSSASLAGRCLLILIDLIMNHNDEGFRRCFSREQYKLSLGIKTSLCSLDLFI